MIKISVIIPVYNAQEYLEETLNSVLSQTVNPIEIICIDDGSEDQSPNILNDYASKYDSIVVLSQKNSGSGKARNYGLKAARGEYVAFLDADDYYPAENTLERLYQKAAANRVYIAGGSFSEFSGDIKSKKYGGISAGYTFNREGIIHYRDYQFDYGYHRFIYNREFLLENSLWFPDYLRYQDPPFFVKAMAKAEVCYVIPDITYCYRIEHKSINWSERKINDLLEGLLDNLKTAKQNGFHKLYWITLKRLQGEFRDIIYSGCYKKNIKMKELLYDLNCTVTQKELPLPEKFFLYYDMKRFVICALRYCEVWPERRAVSKYNNIKRALNGSYFALYGFEKAVRKLVQKINVSRDNT